MWSPAPRLDEGDLTGTFWRFGRRDGPELCPFLVLAPHGRIGNYDHRNEQTWQVHDGRLDFFSAHGLVSTRFDQAERRDGTVRALAGAVRLAGHDVVNTLHRTGHPPLHADTARPDTPARLVVGSPGPNRPNLVVLRAGPSSLHRHWQGGLSDRDRTWDLCVSYYGPAGEPMTEHEDYVTHQPAQRKFEALHDLFLGDSPLWRYERIWFPDDDLATSWADINQLFHIARRERLDLAQPSLRPGPGCHITHAITAQRPGLVLRHTGFVEIMCPVLSRDALRICVGSFRDSKTGFGLDHLWPALLGWPSAGIAIIDEVALVHTRPFGVNYDLDDATAEEVAVRRAYGLRHRDATTMELKA